MKTGFLSLILMSIAIAGCATSQGFNRDELRGEIGSPVVVDDMQIKTALALKPQLPKPFKLAVYFTEPTTNRRYAHAEWRWSGEDKKKIMTLAVGLKSTGDASDVFVIDESMVQSSSLRSLRMAAAQHGADAIMVVNGVSDVDSYNNGLGWTYIALVTALFVPASKTDALFMAHAAMWDVRNEFLYMSAEAESIKHQTRPAAFTSSREAVNEAKADSMDGLSSEISRRFAGLNKTKKM